MIGICRAAALAVGAFMALAAPVSAPVSAQQGWPQKPVRMIVPFPGGGSNDTLCRIVGDKLAAAWNQPVIVDNRPGAGGNVGAEIAFHAEPDGHTLLCSPPGPLAINHNLYKSIPYDWSKFEPVTVLAIVPNVITARLDLPANSAQELIAYAKTNPGKLTFASQGNGSTSHLSAEMFIHMTGIDMVHVPYKGEGPALIDIVAGRVDIFIGNIAAALRFEKMHQVKFLGLAARSRSPVAPDVPDAAEIGLPDLIASAWFAIVAPPGTPAAIVQKVNADTAAALKLPDVRAKFLEQGAEPQGDSSAATAAFIKDEEARWRAVIKAAEVKLE
ncbi:Tripartite-type tricarboxylate transporter, receptor component TctC [Enhydrobacter aerosaccus]|uniref:Tripartite-type tricarboxylate transporter, receptor component TctC n=2 Tax=Enhydrobacter aerosaccus TaxID=225324 RepID=A0A1T4JQW0_9HYPH|nr:Tripartite-type tricarboxylate transporter, receptor component TctC [Enhydrobacter aerosaccus]